MYLLVVFRNRRDINGRGRKREREEREDGGQSMLVRELVGKSVVGLDPDGPARPSLLTDIYCGQKCVRAAINLRIHTEFLIYIFSSELLLCLSLTFTTRFPPFSFSSAASFATRRFASTARPSEFSSPLTDETKNDATSGEQRSRLYCRRAGRIHRRTTYRQCSITASFAGAC